MMPLACILNAQGHDIAGSDRAYDQGVSQEKFSKLQSLGIKLFPQDGSGIDKDTDVLVVSAAVEDTIPDVKAAKDNNLNIMTRAELLAQIFHEAKTSVGIAGTSGKTTVTGMVATILSGLGCNPTVMNGGQVKNLNNKDMGAGANFLIGDGGLFVSEMDESDGSIALFSPTIAVLNNISIDHKPLDELKDLFGQYINRAQIAVLNMDDEYIPKLQTPENVITFSLKDESADLFASNIELQPQSSTFLLKGIEITLNVPGKHNISNALAALGVAQALELDLKTSCKALEEFSGIKRRMELVGEKNGIRVIDDFGHNPDKIAAGLATVKQSHGRVIAMFQPHGFAPLRLMGEDILKSFKAHFSSEDILLMPEVYYAGGTVDRSVTANDIIEKGKIMGLNAHWFEKRADIVPFIHDNVRKGDTVIIMGARDDTLSDFAQEILEAI